jgi:hypothetical protein
MSIRVRRLRSLPVIQTPATRAPAKTVTDAIRLLELKDRTTNATTGIRETARSLVNKTGNGGSLREAARSRAGAAQTRWTRQAATAENAGAHRVSIADPRSREHWKSEIAVSRLAGGPAREAVRRGSRRPARVGRAVRAATAKRPRKRADGAAASPIGDAKPTRGRGIRTSGGTIPSRAQKRRQQDPIDRPVQARNRCLFRVRTRTS